MDWKEEYFKRIEAEKKLEEAEAKIAELEYYIDNLCNSWTKWELEAARDEAMKYYNESLKE